MACEYGGGHSRSVIFFFFFFYFTVSGEVPEEPVVSKKSGLLFERRLIEKLVAVFFALCSPLGLHCLVIQKNRRN